MSVASRVEISPTCKAVVPTKSPSMKHNQMKIKAHYEAWGGEGLDSLLSKSKKGGSLYEMHLNIEKKKRILKAASKDQPQNVPASQQAEESTVPAPPSTFMSDVVVKKSVLQLEKEAAPARYERVNLKRAQPSEEWQPLGQDFVRKKPRIQMEQEKFKEQQQSNTQLML